MKLNNLLHLSLNKSPKLGPHLSAVSIGIGTSLTPHAVALWKFTTSFTCTHLLNKPLQLVSEFAEVARGDESEAALLQTVAGQFNYLVVGKAEHAICQREDALWRVAADDLLNLLFHLSCGLWQETGGACLVMDWIINAQSQVLQTYLGKPLFVDVIHHNNLMVVTRWRSSRAEKEKGLASASSWHRRGSLK